MTLVQLKHFVTLARLGSFAKASVALFMTQPALSRSIKALEDEGIGRPSTYTSTMQSLRLRYVWSKKGDAALIPTVSAFAVDQVMQVCFAELTDRRFTNQMEERLDSVVAGDLGYEDLLSAFWSVGDGTWTPLETLIVNGKHFTDVLISFT